MVAPSSILKDSSSFPCLKRKHDLDDHARCLYPLDRNPDHPWKQAKSDFHGYGSSENGKHLSRLDKARNFAKRDADAKVGAKTPSFSALSNPDRRSECGNSWREGSERGDTQRSQFSARQENGNHHKQIFADEKQERHFKSSEDDRRKGHTVSAFRATSPKHRMIHLDNSTPVNISHSSNRPLLKREALVPGSSSFERTRKPEEKNTFKRIVKLKAKLSSYTLETSDTSKDSNHKVCEEEKKLPCSPSKSNNGSSAEHSWKSSLSARASKSQRPSPSSSELVSADRSVAEPSIPFLHVTRRARSERKRDESSKNPPDKLTSLDKASIGIRKDLSEKQEAQSSEIFRARKGEPRDVEANTTVSMNGCRDSDTAELNSLCKIYHSGAEDEREEGELEPEEDISERHSSESRNEIKHGEASDPQIECKSLETESKGQGINISEGQIDCKEASENRQPHEDNLNSHEMTLSTSNGSEDFLLTVKTKDPHISDAVIGPGMSRRDLETDSSTKIVSVEVSDEGQKSNGYFTAIDLNGSSLCSPDSTGNAEEARMILNLATDCSPKAAEVCGLPHKKDENSSPKQVGTPVSLESSSDRTGDNPQTHGQAYSTPNTEEMYRDADPHVQQEGTDTKDGISLIEQTDELDIYQQKQKRLKVGALEFSLALPGCFTGSCSSAPRAGEHDVYRESNAQKPHQDFHLQIQNSPGPGNRSVRNMAEAQRATQSLSRLRTESLSNGFTASLSLSSFVHNPSCSLNCNTDDEEKELSCGETKQISQDKWERNCGNEQGLYGAASRNMCNEVHRKLDGILDKPCLQNGSINGDNGLPLHVLDGKYNENGQGNEKNHRVASGFGKAVLQNRVRSVDTQAPAFLQKPEVSERNQGMDGKSSSYVKIGLFGIASEPITFMAQKLQELPDSFLEGLKGLVKEVLGDFAKREEFLTLQEIIKSRTDLTEETLLRAHPIQLEILVALKTGMQSFVQQGAKTLTYKALIEIFLQKRCRNVNCQQSLPVDGCECKICSQKKGFCYECMCMVCSKFDSYLNTTRWVGCDVCMHWCHTDCGLRMSHIRSTTVSHDGIESREIQFQCLSCDRYMELYGFVRVVIENFASTWGSEAMAKELDCVRRIFHGSEDVRGKKLRWKAEEMLQMLERNVAVDDVCSRMLHFFSEGDNKMDKAGLLPSKTVQPIEGGSHKRDVLQDTAAQHSIVTSKLSGSGDSKTQERVEECARPIHKEDGLVYGLKDLHQIIDTKLTDVLMYQTRADAAREDAMNLQQIISFKAKKIEEEYQFDCAKLGLVEAEEQLRKCQEELLALERSYQEYQIMKIRIESDMKNLRTKTVERSTPQLA
ncbi:hypothetical protein KP509_22G032700 [Ceratopteris richardii]|uniref:Protein OBERON 4 n=1 Tax=Ceratopteris richardii TaxID=49495 RepID=A0A8T2S734_CERRI|nr:hypothetical protein KP509_22G032700 [Ceratopteris richardii]